MDAILRAKCHTIWVCTTCVFGGLKMLNSAPRVDSKSIHAFWPAGFVMPESLDSAKGGSYIAGTLILGRRQALGSMLAWEMIPTFSCPRDASADDASAKHPSSLE